MASEGGQCLVEEVLVLEVEQNMLAGAEAEAVQPLLRAGY